MSLETIGILSEVIASAAVVISLIYLSVQIRQNTRATKAGTSSYIDEALGRILTAIRSDSEFAGIWLKGCKGLDTLNDIERVRFASQLLDMLNIAEYVHQLEKQQISGTHIDYISWVALLYRDNPGIRSFIDSLDNVGSPELTNRITDTSLARGTNVFETKDAEEN